MKHQLALVLALTSAPAVAAAACDCQDYRNGASPNDDPADVCLGPMEAWGRPCYPKKGPAGCTADWEPCAAPTAEPTAEPESPHYGPPCGDDCVFRCNFQAQRLVIEDSNGAVHTITPLPIEECKIMITAPVVPGFPCGVYSGPFARGIGQWVHPLHFVVLHDGLTFTDDHDWTTMSMANGNLMFYDTPFGNVQEYMPPLEPPRSPWSSWAPEQDEIGHACRMVDEQWWNAQPWNNEPAHTASVGSLKDYNEVAQPFWNAVPGVWP